MKDLADVMELIKVLNLSERLADELNPYVREQYLTLWRVVETAKQLRAGDSADWDEAEEGS
ncbi:MAG: hypothetical protein HY000_33090 [Planctomycetes bacterium]|nr:hypothetical protein [Planctomycetota bacterium]